jgi:hypothetical protein
MVQPCISTKTLIADNPFQRYETKPPNQVRNKIESFGVTPLQEMNSSFFSSCACETLLCAPKHFEM